MLIAHNLHPGVSAPAQGQGIVFHVLFTSRTTRSPWIQVRCIVLSYRPLSVGSTRRWPATYSHSLHVIVALERTLLHLVLSYRPPRVGSTCVQDIQLTMRYVEIEYELWSIRDDHTVDTILLLTRLFYLWYLSYDLMACYGILCWLTWHMLELLTYS